MLATDSKVKHRTIGNAGEFRMSVFSKGRFGGLNGVQTFEQAFWIDSTVSPERKAGEPGIRAIRGCLGLIPSTI